MNRKQKICLWVCIIIIVVMGIYPPWVMPATFKHVDGHTAKHRSYYGYHPIWEGIGNSKASIDFHRLGLQWAIVSVITGGLIVTFKDKKPKDKKDD